MPNTSLPIIEAQQDTLLGSYHILNTAAEQDFDDLTDLAAAICNTPIALISLLDKDRQWFKSSKGVAITEIDQTAFFYANAGLTSHEPLVIEDVRSDERFKSHPLVTGAPYVVFYAGVPLVNEDGFVLGYLCVIDHQTRQLTAAQLKALQTLAKQIVDKLELRRKIAALKEANRQLALTEKRYKQLWEQHAENETRFRSLVEQLPVAIATFKGSDFKVDLFNNQLLEYWDKTGDQVKDTPLLTILPEIHGQEFTGLMLQVLNTGERYVTKERLVMLNRKGKLAPAWFDFTYDPLRDAAGNIVGILLVSIEVTEKVNARQTLEQIITEKETLEIVLRNNERRLQSVLDTMAEGIGITDLSGKLIYANEMAQKILGLTESEIKERTYDDPKWTNLRLDGTPLPPEEHPMAVIMRTGKPVYDFEIGVKPNGKEVFYVSVNAAPLRDHTGALVGGIGTFMDVTARRMLLQQKDEFISVASHELKTPLTALKTGIDLLHDLKDDTTISPLISKLIVQSHKNMGRLINLINDLLDVGRINRNKIELKKTKFTIANVINDCCNNIGNSSAHHITLTGDKTLQICADEQRISQVMTNFINNAVKYAPDSKQIVVHSEMMENNIRVSVTDFGPGIPQNRIPYLFDRFYQASQIIGQGGGLGLGLYISAEIIRSHNGEIGVESELGKGSTFWFTLPITNECN